MKTRIVTLVAFLIALLSPLHAQQAASTKPPVGVPADATRFNGKWYRIYLEKTSWKHALEKCRSLGGQLACVPDAPTQAFISAFGKKLRLWIGATDEKVEGLWLWVDGAEMKYTAWGPNQPNSIPKENYLLLGPDGNWWDITDSYAECVGFICEWKGK